MKAAYILFSSRTLLSETLIFSFPSVFSFLSRPEFLYQIFISSISSILYKHYRKLRTNLLRLLPFLMLT